MKSIISSRNKNSVSIMIMQWLILTAFVLASLHGQVPWAERSGPLGGEMTLVYQDSVSGNLWGCSQVGGVHVSGDNGNIWGRKSGDILYSLGLAVKGDNVYVSTTTGFWISTNGGNSWQESPGAPSYNLYGILSLADTLFVATYGGGVHKSTDNGQNWAATNNGLGSNQNVNVLTFFNGRVFAGTFANGIFISQDYGRTWTASNTGLTISQVNAIVSTGSDIYCAMQNGNIYKSGDNGANWSLVNSGAGTIYSMVANGTEIYVGTNNGQVLRSTNAGEDWTNSDLVIGTAIKGLAISGAYVVAATQHGFWRTNDFSNWTRNNYFITGQNISDAAIINNAVFTGAEYMGIQVSSDQGSSWTERNNDRPANGYGFVGLSAKNDTLFTASYVTDHVYKSTNLGSSWTAVNSTFFSFSYFMGRGDTLLGGGFSGDIHRSTDGGQNWDEIDNGQVSGIVRKIDFAGSTVYVRTDNGMFRTTNGGANWTTLSGTFYDFVADGSSLYRISPAGVEWSPNQGTSWNSINNGLPTGEFFGAIISKYQNRIIVSHGFEQCWVSRNKGASWHTVPGLRLGRAVGIKQSANLAVAYGYGGGVYYWTSPDRYLDSLALVDLYDSANGNSWTNNTNWKTANPIDTWFGVTVEQGRVVEIGLGSNNLSGFLPSSIGNLTAIYFLNMFNNEIGGQIPETIGNLAELTFLNLQNNDFNGQIPATITMLTNLRSLFLDNNELTGQIPTDIGNLDSLRELRLYSNQLTGPVPAILWQLSELTTLGLGGNSYDSWTLPSDIANLTKLEYFHATNSNLTGSIPTEIGNLRRLSYLFLNSNTLAGEIPGSIGNDTLLIFLDLSSNLLIGSLPPEMGNLYHLNFLNVEVNQLQGAVPASISNLIALETLYMGGNRFTSVPDLSEMPALTFLGIDNNRLTFESIEPNIGIATFNYAPQDSVGTYRDTLVTLGHSPILWAVVGGANNQYQWYKDGNLLDGRTSPSLQIGAMSQDDVGAYHCLVTNTLATALTLATRPVNVLMRFPALHVSTSGNDANPGTAELPKRNIQSAVNAALAGDTVKVASGTYTENITLTKQVILRGGYDNSFVETARNNYLNKSTIKPASGTMITDNQSSTIDGFVFDGSSGAWKAVLVNGGHSTVIHNLVHGFFGSGGAGIQVTSSGSATIRNNTLVNNQLSGGGVIIYPIYVEGNADGLGVVQNNIVAYNDNGIYVNPAGVDHDYNCSYANDFMNWDGVNGQQQGNDISADPKFVSATNADVRLKASSPCMDSGNPLHDFSMEPAPNGGRVDMGAYGGTSAATLSGIYPSMYVSVSGNDANDGSVGSPLRNIQTALNRAVGDTVKVAAGTYSEGIITGGSVVLLGGYDGTFQSRNIYNNLTRINGVSTSVIYDRFGIQMDGFLIDGQGNASRGFDIGSGAVISHNVLVNVTASSGFAVRMSGSSQVINNTIRSCDWGVYLESGAAGSVVKNNIINSCSFGIDNNAASGIARYNDFFNNGSNYVGLHSAPGTGDLSVNPLLNNPALLDFRLQAGSPCINAGDPADPVGDEPDPNGGRIDMGAYGGSNVTLPDAVAPNAPVVVSASSGDGTVTLTWRRNAEPDFLRYRIFRNTSANASVQVDSVGTAADTMKTYTGLANGTTYFFRVRALDNSGNLSGFSNEVSATPLGVPSIPTNLTAAVVSSSQINLSWTASGGIPARYRILRSLQSGAGFAQVDSINAPATAHNNTGLNGATTYYFIVEAVNAAGRSGYSNEATATTSAVPPSVSVTGLTVIPSQPNAGQSISISGVTVSGTSPVVKLLYGRNSAIAGDSLTMTFSSGSYSGTIPSGFVTTDGVWYRFKASNSGGVVLHPADGFLSVSVQVGSATLAAVKNSSIYEGSSGLERDAFFSISVPVNSAISLPGYFGAQTFASDGRPNNWRCLSYNASTGQFSDVSTLNPGIGYFLYHRGQTVEDLFSAISSAATNSFNILYGYTLQPGWNLVPWPFAFAANITVIDNTKVGSVWILTSDDWEPRTTVRPYGAYAIFNKGTQPVLLRDAVTWTEVSKTAGSGLEWSILLSVESNGRKDRFNTMGVAGTASDGRDHFDEAEPLRLGEGISLFFVPEQDRNLSTDVRPAGADGQTWNLVFENPRRGTARLQWNVSEFPPGRIAVLYDVDNRRTVALDAADGYAFESRGLHHFKIFAGMPARVQQDLETFEQTLPQHFALMQNYPNPFNPSTTISFEMARTEQITIAVYNAMGQKVKILATGEYQVGRHSIAWDGRDDKGRAVASGVYLAHFRSKSVALSRKMLLLK